MANVLSNKLTIITKNNDIDDIIFFLMDFWDYNSKEFKMNQILKLSSASNQIKKQTWGTEDDIICTEKIDDLLAKIKIDKHKVSIEYETLNNTNINFIKNMSKNYNDLDFMLDYYDSENYLVGSILVSNKEIIYEKKVSLKNNPKKEFSYYSNLIELGFESVNSVINYCDISKKTEEQLIIKFSEDNNQEGYAESNKSNNVFDLTDIFNEMDFLPEIK